MNEKKTNSIPDVDIVVGRDGDSVILKFDKNIGMLRLNSKVASKMADMIKVEAVRIMRGRV